jgi:hypothetical protein
MMNHRSGQARALPWRRDGRTLVGVERAAFPTFLLMILALFAGCIGADPEHGIPDDTQAAKLPLRTGSMSVARAVLGDHLLRHVVIITERGGASRPRVSAALAALSARSIGIVRTRAAPAVRRS